jgi:hypothetical protein
MAEVSRAQRVSTSRRGAARGIVVDGADVVAAAFDRDASTIRPKAEAVVVEFARRAAAGMIERTTSQRVKESITADNSATTTRTGVHADAGPDRRVSNQAFIARFLEHGTVHHAPREFAQPTADELAKPFGDAIAELLGR